MLKNGIIVSVLIALAACGDPLRDMPRLSDVDLVETDQARQALPSQAEIARQGFFGSESDFAYQGGLAASAASTPKRPGLLDILLPTPTAAQPVIRESAPEVASSGGAEASEVIETSTPANVEIAAVSAVPEPKKRGGFFARLTAPKDTPQAQRDGVDALDVSFGTVVPYGVVARVCDARRAPLGRKVESASARGYTLYDSAPGTQGARTYYITGFADDCPRQLTAAHVVLGAPSFYELLHYGPTGAHLVTGETDRAYEKVKSKVCGARKGKPCGAKMKTLERNTFFVNAYERLDDNTRWSELLVHDGQVLAASLKAN